MARLPTNEPRVVGAIGARWSKCVGCIKLHQLYFSLNWRYRWPGQKLGHPAVSSKIAAAPKFCRPIPEQPAVVWVPAHWVIVASEPTDQANTLRQDAGGTQRSQGATGAVRSTIYRDSSDIWQPITLCKTNNSILATKMPGSTARPDLYSVFSFIATAFQQKWAEVRYH